ncbi:thioredoxin-like protein [Paraphysoderma sedebokerense]|nr:thioredoxin-like protein [Paraphysoderma sedebokerense]
MYLSKSIQLIIATIVIFYVTNVSGRALIDLTDSNFDELVHKGEWVVEFYAPWCGYCRRFEPEYSEFADTMAKEFPEVKVGRVNVDVESATTARFFVTRLPTIYHIKHGKVRAIDIKFTKSSLMSYMEGMEWTKVEPWSSWWSPFSMVGVTVSYIGSISKIVTSVTNKLSEYLPQWAIVTLFGGVFFAFLALMAWLIPPPQKTETAQPSAVTEKKGEDEGKSTVKESPGARRRKKKDN